MPIFECEGCRAAFKRHGHTKRHRFCSRECSSAEVRGNVGIGTAERIQLLRDRWDAGDSIRQIGRLMNVSKNTVIGKVHRLGLPGRPSPIIRNGGPSEKHDGRKRDWRARQFRVRPEPWAAWFDGLPAYQQHELGKVAHLEPCKLASVRTRLWLCSCGATNPGGEVYLPAPRVRERQPVVPKAPSRPKPSPKIAVRPVLRVLPPSLPEPEEEADMARTGRTRAERLAYMLARRPEFCNFPIGTPRSPDFRFCDKIRMSGSPYCAKCSRSAFQPHREAA